MVPKSNMTGVLKKGEIWTHAKAQGEHPLKMKAGIRVMHLQAKEHQRFPANSQKLGKSLAQIFPHSPQKEQTQP